MKNLQTRDDPHTKPSSGKAGGHANLTHHVTLERTT